MPFCVLETAIDLAAALRDPLARLQHRDRDLASQARRACNSVALNLDEGRRPSRCSSFSRDCRTRAWTGASGTSWWTY